MPDDTSRSALPEEARERIRLEEELRLKVRSELEEEGSRRANGLLGFLSSRLGIVVISTILVPAIGGLYTQMQQRAAQRTPGNERIIKLMAEFDWRIGQIEFHENRIPSEPDHDKWVSGFVIGQIITGGPNREGDRSFYYPTLPEFKQVHLGGIVTQFQAFGYDDPGGNILQTVEQMEHGDLAVHLVGQPANADHTYDVNTLNAQLATLKQFRSRIAPRSGFWGLLF